MTFAENTFTSQSQNERMLNERSDWPRSKVTSTLVLSMKWTKVLHANQPDSLLKFVKKTLIKRLSIEHALNVTRTLT